MTNNHRYYKIAEITIQVDSDLPITDDTYCQEIDLFRVDAPGNDLVIIHHHFELPDISGLDIGKEIYRKVPWAIFNNGDEWVYVGIAPQLDDPTIHRVAKFNHDHTHAHIFNNNPDIFLRGGNEALTLFPTDQILIARLLAERDAVLMHSSVAILNGHGLLFVGHSGAGKSTAINMLNISNLITQVEVLCEDRNVVRGWKKMWRVYGTWSHGDARNMSSTSAPLKAILFLEQDSYNRLVPLSDRKEIWRRLLATLIKPMVTAEWWQKEMTVLENIIEDVPCFVMHFDRSGAIVQDLLELTGISQEIQDNKTHAAPLLPPTRNES